MFLLCLYDLLSYLRLLRVIFVHTIVVVGMGLATQNIDEGLIVSDDDQLKVRLVATDKQRKIQTTPNACMSEHDTSQPLTTDGTPHAHS